ncbi:MAG: ABC transporter ATP-binding protein [Sporomusaceae bacterium]|nr:ABC transporter ATP-binding protein [Sporomusaceae bacterium]
MKIRLEKVQMQVGQAAITVRADGGVTLLLGPPGAGKSRLLQILAGGSEPTQGKIFFDGKAVTAPERRNLCAYLPQHYGLYDVFSAEEMLEYSALLQGVVSAKERKQRITALLTELGISGRQGQRLSSFSPGMRQKIAVGQALVVGKPLLFLDAPFMSLDPEERNLLAKILVKRGAQQAILIADSDVQTAFLSDRVLVMQEGRIGFDGTVVELAAKAGELTALVRMKQQRGSWEHWTFLLEKGYEAVLQEAKKWHI